MAATDSSTVTRPRKERAENAAKRRRQIIEATLRSVVKNGLSGTTLATVSAEAGPMAAVESNRQENRTFLPRIASTPGRDRSLREWTRSKNTPIAVIRKPTLGIQRIAVTMRVHVKRCCAR